MLNFYAQNPPNSISEYLIFQIFLGGMPPDPSNISMFCMLIVLHTIYTIAINQDPLNKILDLALDFNPYFG